MPCELKNVKISLISLVDKGANQREFAIIKQAGESAVVKSVTIRKTDKARQIVFGVVYEPNVEDAHDDFMTEEEIEKMAHDFMENSNTHSIDKQHDMEADEGYVIESWIQKEDGFLGDQEVKKGSWCVGVKVVSDETWEAIEKGEVTGFSMYGKGERVKKMANSDSVMAKVQKAIDTGIAKIEQIIKGQVRDNYDKSRKRSNFWNAISSFETIIYRYDWTKDQYCFEEDPQKVREAIEDLQQILSEILLQEDADLVKFIGQPDDEVSKAGKQISNKNMQYIEDAITALTELKNSVSGGETEQEDDDVKEEDVAKALAPLVAKIEQIAKQVEEIKGEESQPDPQPAAGTDDQVLVKALQPLMEKIDGLSSDVELLKSLRPGTAQSMEEDPVAKSQAKSYMRSFTGR